MKTILLTCFNPFGGETVNAAGRASALVEPPRGCRLIKEELPTEYEGSFAALSELLARHHPDFLVMLGQAAGRPELTVERIGINLDSAGIADNRGEIRSGSPIRTDGADGYFSTLPILEMARACAGAGIPASVSASAGTFVCNHLLYSALYHIRQNGLPVGAGFIHIPATPAQAVPKHIASMESSIAARGIEAMLNVLIS